MATGYSPVLRLVTANGLKHHFQLPDDTLCCGRSLKLTGYTLAAREYIEQWGDWMVCSQCIARVGAYGPQRPSGRPHLSECPAYRGLPCICDDDSPEWTI